MVIGLPGPHKGSSRGRSRGQARPEVWKHIEKIIQQKILITEMTETFRCGYIFEFLKFNIWDGDFLGGAVDKNLPSMKGNMCARSVLSDSL